MHAQLLQIVLLKIQHAGAFSNVCQALALSGSGKVLGPACQ